MTAAVRQLHCNTVTRPPAVWASAQSPPKPRSQIQIDYDTYIGYTVTPPYDLFCYLRRQGGGYEIVNLPVCPV